MIRIFIALLLISFITGCKNKGTTGGPTQGHLRYKVVYPDELVRQPIASLLPDEMDILFKDNALKVSIKGDLNLFSLEFLSRANGDSCFTLFKVVNKKMVYQLDDNEKWFLFDSGSAPVFEIKDSVRNIAGFNCNLVEIHYRGNPQVKYNAFFTTQIGLNSGLLKTPMGNIPGIPLEFNVVYNGLTFKFVAQQFMPFPTDEKMEVPGDYEPSSREEIRSLIDTVFN